MDSAHLSQSTLHSASAQCFPVTVHRRSATHLHILSAHSPWRRYRAAPLGRDMQRGGSMFPHTCHYRKNFFTRETERSSRSSYMYSKYFKITSQQNKCSRTYTRTLTPLKSRRQAFEIKARPWPGTDQPKT